MLLSPCQYSESFAVAVAVALGSDADFIAGEIDKGICQCWEFTDNGQTLGHAITRREQNEFVVVAYEGENVDAFGDLIVRMCEHLEIETARFHTVRPGLNKLLARLNPEPLEYVMRVKCYGR